ncbi:Structural maintenance of chromosomes 4 [Brachionus plicatilis]|uniref:Structural maintenance of chromosomes protein n=1 Tax=Brachionus plicatilis TaxID=10195 RepID=A0A3M7QBB2_BRAPC|nr:Structural maintenance of chromosomes 4 [Brachionus plicatilis]
MTLVINYIEIENFKSYYGKNILGPFHQSFNAVIGPNGSGKSNVIDSLLFVFGFRAQKIRTKKLSVLIHNSDQHSNVNSCSVKIFFRKLKETAPGKFEVIANSDFTIKRTAYKDNTSEYYINEQKVQYKEVSSLLRENNVDLDHNRFLILQGEVEQISLLKPKATNEHDEGLLEYLEDIIGTIKYKPMLEEVNQEIEKVNEIRTEKSNRVQNLQKDKNDLEGPKNDAVNYLKLENELIEAKNKCYQAIIYKKKEEINARRNVCEEMSNEFQDINEKLNQLSLENETHVTECNLKKKEFDKKSKLSEKLKKNFEDFEKEDVEIREGIKHAKENIKKIQKNLTNEEEKIENLKEIPDNNEKKIDELKGEVADLEEKLEPANKLLESKMSLVNKETKKYQEKKNSLQDKLTELQTKANEAKSKMDIAQSELDVYLKNENYEHNKLEDVRKKLEELMIQSGEKEKLSIELDKRTISKFEQELKSITEELNQISLKEKHLAETVNKNRIKFTEAQSSFSSNRNQSRVLSFLMRLKSEGKIPGIHGRLGDLGAIDQKYDIAVSTACGALDSIVVDNIDTAQKCVEYLKTNNVGSAHFIALDKQEKWRDYVNRKITTPENVPRLVDLIKVNDQKFLTAFYFGLRNTLVANDLDQATRIAYGQTRNRVVTLKGEIIEVTGTMSGGGQPSKGRMGSKITEEFSSDQLKKMEDTLKIDQEALREMQNRKQELEPSAYDLKHKIDKAKNDLIKLKNEVSSLKDQVCEYKKIEANCVQKLKEINRDEAKQKNLEENLEKLKNEFQKADQSAAKLRDENDELHRMIVEISQKILDEPKASLKNLETKISEKNAQISDLTLEIKTSKRNLVNSEKKLVSLKEDLELNETNLEKFKNRLENMDENGKELVEQHESIKKEIEELESEIKQVSKVMKQNENKIQKLEAERIDLKHKMDKSNEELKSEEKECKHFEHAISSLKLHNTKNLEKNVFNDNESTLHDGPELEKFDEDYFTGFDIEGATRTIRKLEENLKSHTPNLSAIQNYKELMKKFMERVNELDELNAERDKLCNDFEELRKKRLDEFMAGFTQIRLKLKEIYRTVTIEGDAELELVDTLDPFTEGIVLSVRPPKKSWKNVSNLSGGEKTLSSLSLVFALHEFRATPIYVMDEIDAALDFKNVSIIAHYIKERTKNAQFIIISLRNNMFELCDRLFGIYKVRNCTSASFIAPEYLELEEKKRPNKSKAKENEMKVNEVENEENNEKNNRTLAENANANNSMDLK